MLSVASSSRSLLCLYSRILSISARAARIPSSNYACNRRLLSAEADGRQQANTVPPQSVEGGGRFDSLLSIMKETLGKYDPSPSSKHEQGKSRFKQAKESIDDKNSKVRKAVAEREKILFHRRRKMPKTMGSVRPQVRPSKAGAGKTAQRRWKRDLKTLSELVRTIDGNVDSSLKVESWKDNWGEDSACSPPSPPLAGLKSKADADRTPHAELAPTTGLVSYARRREGLIEQSETDGLEEIESPGAPIATLAHGLDRVLFNPGVHWVQDPRSRVYNFTPFIQNVPDVKDFAFERLNPFTASSRDTVLRNLAMAKGKRFAGSTSSLTGLLCHVYFLLSNFRSVDLSTLATPFSTAPATFTRAQRMPTAVVFNHRDGVYLIDSDSTDNDDSQLNILMWMGTMLENFLTLPKAEFGKLLRSVNSDDNVEKPQQAYRYTQSNSFVMRAQLDCVDPRLPGTGVFDIKTRAALPLRMDNLNFEENSGYLITSLHGALNSFDREYYDLIRAAFLKYSFQVRIGGMDGIFLAYHNTAQISGFQYVSLEEMDQRVFGIRSQRRSADLHLGQHETGGTAIGWRMFNKCVRLLEAISAEVVECFPGKTVACLAETRKGIMRIWVQPVDEKPETDSKAEEIPSVATDSERPIIQLDITARSFLDGKPIISSDKLFSSMKPWTVHWSISRSSLPESTIRRYLSGAKGRKNIPKAYPTGVNEENLEEFIMNLGFVNREHLPEKMRWRKAGRHIMSLRKLSRKGKLASQRMQSEEERKGLQIWQQADLSDPNYHQAFSTEDGREAAQTDRGDSLQPANETTELDTSNGKKQ